MTYRKNYIEINNPFIQYLTDITGNSLPYSLGLSLLETVARLNSPLSSEIKILVDSLSELIKNSIEQYPNCITQLQYFEQVCNYILKLPSPKQSLEYLESITINNFQPEFERQTYYINLASQCILSTLLTQKLKDRGEPEKIYDFFKDTDIRDLDHPIFIKFSEYFMVAIKIYEGNGSEVICIEKNANYPIIHLFKSNYLYSLAYPKIFIELKRGSYINPENLLNEPFVLKKRKNCPIMPPILHKKSQENIVDYSNDVQVMSMLINLMSRELINHKIFTNELLDAISISLKNNKTVKNIKGVVDYSNYSTNVEGARMQRKCFRCPKMIDSSLNISHSNCEVCLDCVVELWNTGRCPRCQGFYTNEDRIKLRLP